MPYRKYLPFLAIAGAFFMGAPGSSRGSDSPRASDSYSESPAKFRSGVWLRDSRGPQQASSLPPGAWQLSLQPTTFTPYDHYMHNVRTVISHLDRRAPSMSDACRLMLIGHQFRYVEEDPYSANPPEMTAEEQAGDCKAKALWLYHELGDADALFVIGKAYKYNHTSHAWVYWRHENRWWILDCTNRSEPIAADTVPKDRYVPYYSFGKSGAYRHKATSLLVNGIPATSNAPAVTEGGFRPQGGR